MLGIFISCFFLTFFCNSKTISLNLNAGSGFAIGKSYIKDEFEDLHMNVFYDVSSTHEAFDYDKKARLFEMSLNQYVNQEMFHHAKKAANDFMNAEKNDEFVDITPRFAKGVSCFVSIDVQYDMDKFFLGWSFGFKRNFFLTYTQGSYNKRIKNIRNCVEKKYNNLLEKACVVNSYISLSDFLQDPKFKALQSQEAHVQEEINLNLKDEDKFVEYVYSGSGYNIFSGPYFGIKYDRFIGAIGVNFVLLLPIYKINMNGKKFKSISSCGFEPNIMLGAKIHDKIHCFVKFGYIFCSEQVEIPVSYFGIDIGLSVKLM